MQSRALRLSASIAALAAGMSVEVAAKAADADQPIATANASAANTVPTLTITAERRTINLQTAPVAASVIAGNQLQTEGITTLDDLQFHTPSLTVSDFGQGNQVNIRGIGKDLGNIQTPSGVVTYWDGVAAFPGFFQNASYYDIASVEVERGPQGTFAGQNASGGALFITTNDPSLSRASGYLEGGYGNYSDAMVQGYLNLPLSSTLALRIALDGERRDSFYTVTGGGTTPSGDTPGRLLDGSVRVGLLWEPSPQWKFLLKGEYDYVDKGGFPADPTLNILNPAQLNPSDPFNVTNNALNYATAKFLRISLNASYTFGDGIVLRSITGYQYGITNEAIDLDGTDIASLTFSDYGQERIYSEELNLVSPDKGPLKWVTGLYFQSDTVDIPPLSPPGTGFDIGVPHGVVDLNLIYHTPKGTEAVFGQVSYDITPQFDIQVGARFTHTSFSLDDNNFVDFSPAGGAVFNGSVDDNAVTGKVALNYRPDDNNTLYAFVAEGHKQNGLNTGPATPFGPEFVTDVEGGWKPTFLDGHLKGQFGVYYSWYRGFQLQFFTPAQMSLIQNVSGTTTLYGAEAETQAVFGHWAFNASASYEHSSLGAALIVDPTTGLPVQMGGRVLPFAPSWTADVGVQYGFDVGPGKMTPRIDYSYVTGQWTTPFQHFGEFLPARNLVNAELRYDWDTWSGTLYITNAFNLHYIIDTNVGVPFELRYAGAPQQFGLRVSKRF